jgi:Pyruvate/2-oxoacid:ferredoxin oxidoreductase delta subunit
MRQKRNIVRIDESKCNGCGQCVTACAEGAIQLVDGKARLVSEVYCDGLGACLGECPQGAITIEQREAAAFDETATHRHLHEMKAAQALEFATPLPCGCPGTLVQELKPKEKAISAGASLLNRSGCPGQAVRTIAKQPGQVSAPRTGTEATSELTNWPLQLRLVPPTAPYLQDADLLLVADCVPFALADFHQRFLQGKPVVIGCPKLDDGEYYVQKLSDILTTAHPQSVTILRMEVPCCGGLLRIAEAARQASGVGVPLRQVTVGINGTVLDEGNL